MVLGSEPLTLHDQNTLDVLESLKPAQAERVLGYVAQCNEEWVAVWRADQRRYILVDRNRVDTRHRGGTSPPPDSVSLPGGVHGINR